MSLTFLKSQKGSDNLVFSGFVFTKDGGNKNEGTTYWKCTEYKRIQCRGRVTTKDDKVIRHTDHNHTADIAKIECKNALAGIKRKAISTLHPPTKIIADMSNEISVAASGKLPTVSSICRTIQRTRRDSNCPTALPKSLTEMTIPVEYMQIDISGKTKEFLLYDSGKSETRVLIFGTNSSLRLLELAPQVFGDGTFKTAPKLFQQLYTLHGIVNGSTLPLIYILLPNKEYLTYRKMLEALKAKIPAWQPRSVTTDFEAAALRAFREVFPGTIQRGCYFHFGQCIWRKIQSLGSICSKYTSDADFVLNMRLLGALAFIPVDEVIYSFEIIQQLPIFQEGGEIVELLEYFEDVWIGKSNRFSRTRESPKFPISLCNCYESTLLGEARTNNSLEGWHRGFDVRIGSSHPNMWKFLDALKVEESFNHLKIEQQLAGTAPPPQRRKYKDSAKRVLDNTSKYATLPRTIIQNTEGPLTFTVPPDVGGSIRGMVNPIMTLTDDLQSSSGQMARDSNFRLLIAPTEVLSYLRSIAHNLEFNV
ncbi:unnamed protein product [Allacma fusca]|uniref:MULE transposase domain-containing protein n=1 Tax=Allacma fusca TaxID=39272 RepID=A0A8J2NYH6_9HEXA|nr:unnamed protein product [Allacma fusca]